jgi:aldehyde dehydrogenase (NAD+)
MNTHEALLDRLGLRADQPGVALGDEWKGSAPLLVHSPIDRTLLSSVRQATPVDVGAAASTAIVAFHSWRSVPAPIRGEFVRRIGEEVRHQQHDLAGLITLEAGKIPSEALGEVREWVDVCDFAVGLSRQLHGLTIASERPQHRMMEQWHPLGPLAVITAFNFPMAVWAWNAMIALVCGNSVTWKPSEKTPLCALAAHRLCQRVASSFPEAPPGLLSVLIGGREIGSNLAAAVQYPLVSATGSVAMGRAVGQVVAQRLGRSLLELGGNNALILAPSADLEIALRAIVFAAAGTAGQRCTSLRRLIVHDSIYDRILTRLVGVMRRLPVGDPRQPGILIGPLIDEAAGQAMRSALHTAQQQGGVVHGGDILTEDVPQRGTYVRPAVVEISPNAPIVSEETFAPIVYYHRYRDFSEAVAINNGVPQGLSSAVFTNHILEAEHFLGPDGSDCGIANVNIGTSGAEIGGAFGGEKWTGGGRESGSDSWKAYMRRATNTVNYGSSMPLAQGVEFDF